MKLDLPEYNNDPTWLSALRQEHIGKFLKQGFPSRKNENWKYTSLASLQKNNFVYNSEPTHLPHINLEKLSLTDDVHTLIFYNGYFQSHLSNIQTLPKNVSLGNLQSVLHTHKHLVSPFLKKANIEECPFATLNTAFLCDGVFLHIPKNTHVEKPIHCIYISDKNNCMQHVRCILLLEENSQATLIKQFTGKNDACYFNNITTQIKLDRSANLKHYKLQQETSQSYHIETQIVSQSENSHYHSTNITLGAALSRDDLYVKLEENHSQCSLSGLYLPKEKQHMDHHIQIDHLAENTMSEQNYKGILKDQSHAVFNGKTIVHEGASNTKAKQSNKNILLSNQAEIDTKPELEIYHDDVKCTHGATVGQLDPEALFYLQSRGIQEEQATKILLDAFSKEILESIQLETLRNHMEGMITC